MMTLPINHPPVATPKIGVLLVNLGTPDAPTKSAVKRYLKQFLSDRRVVEIPQIIWQPILRGIILNTRPRKSAQAYAKVWTDKGSPLAFFTAGQAAALQARMGESADVRYAMRYGNPSVADQLAAMKKAGCNRILIAPMYPQYSAATNATVVDDAARALMAVRWQPTLRTMAPYFDNPDHIAALAQSIRDGVAKLDFVPDLILTSFHGMPLRTLEAGDPYHCQCMKTGRLLGEALGMKVKVTFQSRFGRAEWLKPYTDDTLLNLPKDGVQKIAVVSPGFAADCLETLEEVAMEGRDEFIEAGGTHFAYIPCLNDSDTGMAMLENIVRRELAGWL
jgi:ferrochelatase